jgi:hypothetical protein
MCFSVQVRHNQPNNDEMPLSLQWICENRSNAF